MKGTDKCNTVTSISVTVTFTVTVTELAIDCRVSGVGCPEYQELE